MTLFPNSGGALDWYYDGLGVEYSALNTFMWLACWGLLILTFGVPFGMLVHREVSRGSDIHLEAMPGLQCVVLGYLQYFAKKKKGKAKRKPQALQRDAHSSVSSTFAETPNTERSPSAYTANDTEIVSSQPHYDPQLVETRRSSEPDH